MGDFHPIVFRGSSCLGFRFGVRFCRLRSGSCFRLAGRFRFPCGLLRLLARRRFGSFSLLFRSGGLWRFGFLFCCRSLGGWSRRLLVLCSLLARDPLILRKIPVLYVSWNNLV